MAYVIIGHDAPDSREKRPQVRSQHLACWTPFDEAGRVILGGQMTDFAGSILVIEAESLEEATGIAENDPYLKEGVFASVEVHPYRCVLPKSTYAAG